MSETSDLIAKAYDQNSLWIKLVSIATGLYGFSLSLSIIGAIVGIPMIYCAVILWQSVGLARSGQTANAIDKTMFYFKLFGILTLLSLVGMLFGGFMGFGMMLMH